MLGWIIWPLRVDTYSPFWMPILGAFLALMVRSIFLQIRGERADHDVVPPSDRTKLATTTPDSCKGELTWHCSKPAASRSRTAD